MTALEIERRAVCRAFRLRDRDRVRVGARTYWSGSVPLSSGGSYRLVVAQQPDTANIQAALLVADLLRDCDPTALLLVGLAAAASEDVALGDVVVAREVFYYERGKVTTTTTTPAREPKILIADARLFGCVSTVPRWRGPRMLGPAGVAVHPSVHFGVVASGEKVVADEAFRTDIVEQHRKVLAIEMEAFGFGSAAVQTDPPRRHLVIRGICDRGDRRKADDWQPYAATAAAHFAQFFLEQEPIPPRGKEDRRSRQVPVNLPEPPLPTPAAIEGEVKRGLKEGAWDVFLSYSTEDLEPAQEIQAILVSRGLRVWFDRVNLRPGDIAVREIEKALDGSRAVVFLVSQRSVASGWVEEEYTKAISLSKRDQAPVRLIPVLLDMPAPPGFLASRVWVDFRDKAKRDTRVDELLRGILESDGPTQPRTQRLTSAKAGEPQPRVSAAPRRLGFLTFFPEGLLWPVFSFLVKEKGVSQKAQRLVQRLDTGSGALAYIDASGLGELSRSRRNEAAAACAVLDGVERFLIEHDPFANMVELGRGRALLVRDLLGLAQYLDPIDEGAATRREAICGRAREVLPWAIREGQWRLAAEISSRLLAAAFSPLPADYLRHATVLVRIGRPGEAIPTFDLYLGQELFEGADLSELERVEFALDWAKAVKETGHGRGRHAQLLQIYERARKLVDAMLEQIGDDPAIRMLLADLLHNRATQLSVFGGPSEWREAQTDFVRAADTYQHLGEHYRFIACRTGLIDHQLEHVQAPALDLGSLLRDLDDLQPVALRLNPGEEIFFFHYQRARLLRRLGRDMDALAAYSAAREAAHASALAHRRVIADRWIIRLRFQSQQIGEAEYLAQMTACIADHRRHARDAWSSASLTDALLRVAHVHQLRKEWEELWACCVEAVEVIGRGTREPTPRNAPMLRLALGLLDAAPADETRRVDFAEQHRGVLRIFITGPSWQALRWDDIALWLKGGGVDGHGNAVQ